MSNLEMEVTVQVVENCFAEYEKDFTDCLLTVEFSPEQATHFLPLAMSGIITSVERTSVYQTISSMLARPYNHSSNLIDVTSIAAQSQLDRKKVSSGLDAIAQVLLIVCAKRSEFKKKSG